jgi:hypothetical protein
VTVRYASLRFVGSMLLGGCFALPFTLLAYVAGNRKPEILILFFPLAILFTRVIVWGWGKAQKENADRVRSRYKSGKLPLGE